MYLSIDPYIYIYIFIYLSIHIFTYSCIYICVSTYPSMYLFMYLCSYPFVDARIHLPIDLCNTKRSEKRTDSDCGLPLATYLAYFPIQDRGLAFLRNVSKLLPNHKASYPRKEHSSYSPLRADCLKNVEASTSHNPVCLHNLLQG
jgi:hypothetical protein